MKENERRLYGFLMSWLKNVETARPKDAGERWVRDYNLEEVGSRLNDLLQVKLKPLKKTNTERKKIKQATHSLM